MIVLIIDSSNEIAERLGELLFETKTADSIHIATSYELATRLFLDKRPDVVLLDVYLHDNGAIKLLKEVKKTGNKAVFIMLSLHADHYLLEQCKILGANFFIDVYHDFEKIPGIISAIEPKKIN